jgi:hypothetical protein
MSQYDGFHIRAKPRDKVTVRWLKTGKLQVYPAKLADQLVADGVVVEVDATTSQARPPARATTPTAKVAAKGQPTTATAIRCELAYARAARELGISPEEFNKPGRRWQAIEAAIRLGQGRPNCAMRPGGRP